MKSIVLKPKYANIDKNRSAKFLVTFRKELPPPVDHGHPELPAFLDYGNKDNRSILNSSDKSNQGYIITSDHFSSKSGQC